MAHDHGRTDAVREMPAPGGNHTSTRLLLLADHQLQSMPVDRLVAYIVTARRRGEARAATCATQLLAQRFKPLLRARVRDSGSVHHDLVAEVAERVFLRALGARFDGSTVGEWVKFLERIVQREIADFYGSRAAKTRRLEVLADPDFSRRYLPDQADAIIERLEATSVLRDMLATVSSRDAAIFLAYRACDRSAADVAREYGVTRDVVYQVSTRLIRRAHALAAAA